MSGFYPKIYNRNNVVKHGSDADRQCLWGFDYAVHCLKAELYNMTEFFDDSIIDKLRREVIEEAGRVLITALSCYADGLMCDILDGLPEGVELDEVPEEDRLESLVKEDADGE